MSLIESTKTALEMIQDYEAAIRRHHEMRIRCISIMKSWDWVEVKIIARSPKIQIPPDDYEWKTWCNENIPNVKGRRWRRGLFNFWNETHSVFFENQQDAVAFKLRFG